MNYNKKDILIKRLIDARDELHAAQSEINDNLARGEVEKSYYSLGYGRHRKAAKALRHWLAVAGCAGVTREQISYHLYMNQ